MQRPIMKLLPVTVLATALIGTPALADRGGRTLEHRFTDYADVIDVRPRIREVSIREPSRECWIEEQRHMVTENPPPRRHHRERRTSGADTLVGGVIGGVIGNQLARNSSHRTGATVAGAVIGSVVANEARGDAHRYREPRRHYSAPVYASREVEKCRRTVATRYEERVQGYDVTYRYRGQTYTTHMYRDPGSRLELAVSVKPARH